VDSKSEQQSNGGPSPVTGLMGWLEDNPLLEQVASVWAPLVIPHLGSGRVGDLLRGRMLGHALHPLLTQVPIGALVSAIALDAAQRSDAARQSRFLVGLACLSAVPAALSGVAEWTRADRRTQRVGVAHAGLNLLGTTTAIASFAARRKGWSPAATLLAAAAGTAYGLSGMLGGHLSLVRKYASHDRPSDLDGVDRGEFTA
jgi:uncharacterized membrane protein